MKKKKYKRDRGSVETRRHPCKSSEGWRTRSRGRESGPNRHYKKQDEVPDGDTLSLPALTKRCRGTFQVIQDIDFVSTFSSCQWSHYWVHLSMRSLSKHHRFQASTSTEAGGSVRKPQHRKKSIAEGEDEAAGTTALGFSSLNSARY